MDNYGEYVTPEQAKAGGDTRSLAELRSLVKTKGKCQCGEQIWRYGGCGMCFSCTTGEADASEDFELVQP